MKSAVETTEMIWLEVTEMNRAKNCAKNFNSFSRTREIRRRWIRGIEKNPRIKSWIWKKKKGKGTYSHT